MSINQASHSEPSQIDVLAVIQSAYEKQSSSGLVSAQLAQRLAAVKTVLERLQSGESEQSCERDVLNVIADYYRAREATTESSTEMSKTILASVASAQIAIDTRKRKLDAQQSEQCASSGAKLARRMDTQSHKKYMVITQHVGKRMILAAFDESSRLFFEVLLERIKMMPNHYAIGKQFMSAKAAEHLKSKIAPGLGYSASVFDCVQQQWSEPTWIKCKKSVFDLLLLRESEKAKSRDNDCTASERVDNDVENEMSERKRARAKRLLETYLRDFSALILWFYDLLDEFRDMLGLRLLFTTFQHCYLDLVYLEAGECALVFYERFSKHFCSWIGFNDDLLTLRSVTVKHLMEVCDSVAKMRALGAYAGRPLERSTFTISKHCSDFLQHSIRMDRVPASICVVMRAYIDFLVE